MKRTSLRRTALASTGLFAAAVALATTAPLSPATAAGNGGTTPSSSSVPTFAEFKADTFVDTDGQYIINGDEALDSDAELKAYYEQMTRPSKKGSSDPGLIVNTVGGYLDLWSQSQAGNLTYCVSNSFGADKAAMVSAMAGGAAMWEDAASAIDFRYVPSQDSNCRTSNNNVLFPVQPTYTTQYIARAFFPSSSDAQRNVLVNAYSAQNSGSWAAADVLGHELGHVLGFRHEHTRPEAGTCFEDNNWYALTPYDSSSIMHYPQCNGASSDLSFSYYDGQGVLSAYGG